MDDMCSADVGGDLWRKHVEVDDMRVFEGICVYPSLAEVALKMQ